MPFAKVELMHEQKSSSPNTWTHWRSLSCANLPDGIFSFDVCEAAYVADDSRITKVTQSDSFMITNVPQNRDWRD